MLFHGGGIKMITLLTFWISCRYSHSPAMLYVGTVLIDMFALDIIGSWLCDNKKDKNKD